MTGVQTCALPICWYVQDAYQAQSKTENMLLIGPAALITVTLVAFLGMAEVRRILKGEGESPAPEKPATTFKERLGTPMSAAALVVFVLLMPLIGFDIAAVLFVAGSMVMQGARDWRVIAGFSLIMGLLPVWALENVLSVPVPTLII